MKLDLIDTIAIIVLLAIGLVFSAFVLWIGIKHGRLGGISTVPPDRPRINKPKRHDN